MAVLRNYLTSLGPDMSQTIYSQSIGGYISNSLLYPETTLSSNVGLYGTTISLETPLSGSWSEWQGVEYINIGNEMIKVSPMTNGTVSVIQRGYNVIINMNIANDRVRAESSKELLNNVFSDDYKQYRCIAIKNDSLIVDPSGDLNAYNFGIYLKQNSRNSESSIRISLEQPNSQYLASASTSWTTQTIVDESLIGVYSDDHFNEAYLKVLSGDAEGQGKIVLDFVSATGTFTFYDGNTFSADYDYTTNVSYEVLPAPAQRIKTGIVSPVDTGDNVTSFVANNEQSPLYFWSGNFNNPIITDLLPNDVVYVWIERTVEKGVENFDDNDIVLNVKYSVSE
jgi:hypothetical protein